MKNRTKNIIKLSSSAALLTVLSSATVAELKAIDDEALANVEGRAGLSIDIDMGVSVAEFMYKDAGAITMQGIRLGGMNMCGDTNATHTAAGGSNTSCTGTSDDNVGTLFGKDGVNRLVADGLDPTSLSGRVGGTTGLNNARINVDVAGDGTTDGTPYLTYLGSTNPTHPLILRDNQVAWAWGDIAGSLCGTTTGAGAEAYCRLDLKDGDLFISSEATDASIVTRSYQAVDFGFEMDRFALQASDYKPGDDIVNPLTGTETDTTTIFSNFKMEGFLGGLDILIENDGNGFGATDLDLDGRISQAESDAGTGYGDANSKIVFSNFFEITEMEYDFDIVGIRYEKIAIHNRRGRDDMFNFDMYDYDVPGNVAVSSSQGFAQSNTQLYAVKDNIVKINVGSTGGSVPVVETAFVDGVTFNSRLMADMDIEHLSFGDTDISIGSQRWTDMDIWTKQTISAH